MLNYFVGAVAGFGLASLVTREQGSVPAIGQNLVLYRGGGRCVHVHHWVPCVLLALFVLLLMPLNSARCQLVVGGLVGASATDFVYYSDYFQFDQACEVAFGAGVKGS